METQQRKARNQNSRQGQNTAKRASRPTTKSDTAEKQGSTVRKRTSIEKTETVKRPRNSADTSKKPRNPEKTNFAPSAKRKKEAANSYSEKRKAAEFTEKKNRTNNNYPEKKSTLEKNSTAHKQNEERTERQNYTAKQNKVKKPKKITKYRKPLNINIGMLIFGVVFIYVIICVVLYFRTGHIVRYEVQKGTLATNNIYEGVIIRQETVVNTETAGYVNYYAREGERVAKDGLVCVIDETGRLNEELENVSLGENTLSDRKLAEFRSEIVNFIHGYDSLHYEDIYNFKYSLKNTVLKLANVNMLEGISGIDGTGLETSSVIHFCNAPVTGIVAYWTDGYETLTAENVTMDTFKEEDYNKQQLVSNSLTESGTTAYKMTTDENWSVVIPIDAERGTQMEEEGYVKVRFLKNQHESWAATKLLRNPDGNTYLQLSFTNSMVTFISDRFLDVELIINEEQGLKIPNSSIVEKEFFLIPKDFIIEEVESGKQNIIKQAYLEDGTISANKISVDVYSYDEETEEYYLDASVLDAGDIIYNADKSETYTISSRAALIGVYNINKGYADFREINILYQNEEYSIVKANTRYGLEVYDYIVLNAEIVRDNQFINE